MFLFMTCTSLSKKEKRNISTYVAKWIPENCIQCGQCALVCPHAVIRPFVVSKENGIPMLGKPEYNYEIAISEADCTSCGLCVNTCPGKMGAKALKLDVSNEENQKRADYLFEHGENPEIFDKFSIKGSQFKKPCFEFSGACAGCGETPYLKLLSQLFGNELVISNATGCSSIYGGSAISVIL